MTTIEEGIFLPEELREAVYGILSDVLTDVMFDDEELNFDYVMCGFEFKGLLNMTDEELVEEYKSIFVDDENEKEVLEDELWQDILKHIPTKNNKGEELC